MKAYRNIGGNVVEIDVDVDPSGNPLLPPDTTIDPEPAPIADHYNTVVGNAWVQIPYPTEYKTFEYQKQLALEKLKKYKDWYLNQPVDVNGTPFDSDEVARNRLTQALVIYNQTAYLPPAWIDANDTPVPLTIIDDLLAIVSGVQNAFSTKFFEVDTIRQDIMAAADQTALDAIVVPEVPELV
jgi:hypothetical protein